MLLYTKTGSSVEIPRASVCVLGGRQDRGHGPGTHGLQGAQPGHLVEDMVFPVVMYGCESWTVKKVERRRIDAFEL